MAKAIKEEDGVHKAWYDEARKVQPGGVDAFINRLATDYTHDYGTICHAIAASAIAAAWAMERTPQGGITGFQAGAIFWEFYRAWMSEDGPAKLVKFENMLFPQYAEKFDKVISAETWEWLREQAARRLADEGDGPLSAAVRDHWRSIAHGDVPFGYRVEED